MTFPPTRAAITATGLVKTFGATRALDGVDLEVPHGTVLGLLGPNGAGKTTAVRVLTTQTRPDAGTATVLGRDVVADAEQVRPIIGLAGQYAAVDERLTGIENLVMVGRLNHLSRKGARRRAGELLERFSLTEAGSRPARTYSGGMRRRLDLAASLVAAPPILFLDEPTTGLDPRSRVELWGVIEELVADGTTLLLTTQYLEEADKLADEIVVIDHGRVIAKGSSADLKAQVGREVVEFTFGGTDAAVRSAGVLAGAVTGAGESVEQDGATVKVHTAQAAARLGALAAELHDRRLVPTSVDLRRPTLDDAFLALTGRPAGPDGGEHDAPTTDEAERPLARIA